jgi:hypothetical protein
MYSYLMLLTIASAVSLQGWNTLFNNFAVDNAGLNGFQVGTIQSVREIPGFISLLVIYVLLIMKEHRLSSFSVLVSGAAVLVTGFFPSFTGLLITTFIMSMGFHYFETTNQSLTLQYFNHAEAPIVLSKQRSWNALANVIIGLVIWGCSFIISIKWLFALTGVVVILVTLYTMKINPEKEDIPLQHRKLIFRKKYTLFYILNLLGGARRQIFIVFAVFLLVDRYRFTLQEITILFIINNIVNYITSPYIGKAINRFGEKKMLSFEYFSVIFIFLAYAFIESAMVAASLYVIDNILFNFAIGIRTYFQKTADPADIAPSMAVGFTINHIVAVVLPLTGGALWLIDFRIPFAAGSALGLVSLLVVQRMKDVR